MFSKRKDDEIKALKNEVSRLTKELSREKERQSKKKIGYREKCLSKAVKMARELGVKIPAHLQNF